MVVKLCLMASHGYLPGGVVLPQDHGISRDCPPVLPSNGPRHEIMSLGSLNFRTREYEEAWKPTSRFSDSTNCIKFEQMIKLPTFMDAQDASSSSMLFNSAISEHCTRHERISQILASGASDLLEGAGLDVALLSQLIELQSTRTDLHDKSFPLIYRDTELYTQKPVLDLVGELVGSSNVTVHPDGRVLLKGTGTDVRDLLSLVAELYVPKALAKGGKQSMLIPQFRWLSNGEVVVLEDPSPKATAVATLKSLRKAKTKSPKKKLGKKKSTVRNLYQKNYFHACESLLSIIANHQKHRKTAVLALKKSGTELPELLSWFSATIAGTALTVLFSVAAQLTCSRIAFCSSKILSTGLGLGLFWLSGAVNKLRDTIVYAGKNTGKLGLKEEEVMTRVDKSVKEIYIRAATLFVVAVMRFA